MITYKEVPSIRREFVSIQCDKCGKVFDDEIEIQEFHRIHFTGGYGSVFGDGDSISCDICQYCLKEMIGSFCKTLSDESVRVE